MTTHQSRRLIPHILRQWPPLAGILALTMANSGLTALEPWPMKVFVDYALGTTAIPGPLGSLLQELSLTAAPTTLIMVAALGSLALFTLRTASSTALGIAWAVGGYRMVYDLASHLFHRLQRLSLLFHSHRAVGDSLSRLTDDAYCVFSVTDELLMGPAGHLLTLATVVVVAWTLDSALTLLALAVAPVLGASSLIFGPRLKRPAQLSREAESRLLSFVHQTLTTIPVVQAFSTEARNRRQFERLAKDALVLSQRGGLLSSGYGVLNGLIASLGTAVILYVGGQRVLSGTLSLGSLLVFLAYLQSMQGASQGLLGIYGKLKPLEARVDRVLEILDAEEQVRDCPGASELGPEVRGHVRLEGVTVGYEAGRPVLVGVTVEARPGETVAVVGPTGAGKSTLVSLIPRFFDPWEGRVLFDGVDVREVQLTSLRAQVALVLQEPFLLPLTLAENIAYGRPGASREAIVAAAVAANADEFIRRLPKAYDTVIGERGATLSGGEKQRLAIARALLKDAPVLILDEPTAALDAQTEALVLDALERLMDGRTTFVIAHRLSTVRRADRIVILQDGRIVDTGTHQELVQRAGLYHRFHALQVGESPGEVTG